MKQITIAAVVVLAIVLFCVFRPRNHGSMQSIPDGTSVTAQSFGGCPAGSLPILVKAKYGLPNGSKLTNVLPKVQALINSGQSFTVNASTLGATSLNSPGALFYSVANCMDTAQVTGKSGFRQCPPFISCDRSYDLDYGVDATVRNGSAIVWSPYVAGSQYAGWPSGWDSSTGQSDWACKSDKSADNKKKEGFEPIPCLPCNTGMIPPLGDAAEVDRPYTDAPVPQPLLYSTIANLPPARGVKQQLETEPETTVTMLSSDGRVAQMADPYLSDAQRFGPSPYEIPPNDPGYMVPVTDFMESFTPKPGYTGILRKITGGRAGFGPVRTANRFQDSGWGSGGPSMSNSSSVGFGKSAITAKRSRRR